MRNSLHAMKAYSIQEITGQLNRLTQLKRMTDAFPEERKELVDYVWSKMYGDLESPSRKLGYDKFFSELLTENPETMKHLGPQSAGEEARNREALDIDLSLVHFGMDRDKGLVERFVAAIQDYSKVVLNSEAPAPLAEKSGDLKKALYDKDNDQGITNFVNEVMGSYVAGFDLDRVSFGKSQNYGDVAYGASGASEVISEFQRKVKFDLKVLGKNTEGYESIGHQGEALAQRASAMLKEQSFMERLASKIREKDRDVDRSHLSEFGM